MQEIGCSKLQGFYYSKPIPFKTILEMHQKRALIENENPEESDYYESIGRVNLFDLGVIASEDDNTLQHSFNIIPIAILEIKGDIAKYIRSNRSFQFFAKRFFNLDILEEQLDFRNPKIANWANFVSAVKQCSEGGTRTFFDEKVADGAVFHFFARRIHVNPVTGSAAVAIAMLSISEPGENEKYAEIARKLQEETKSLGRIAALSPEYIVLYTVDPVTGHYTQYNPSHGFESFGLAKQGDDFFTDVVLDAPKAIAPEDMERHLRVLTKENMLRGIEKTGLFIHNYRLLLDGKTVPVSLRAALVKENDKEMIILGVTNDEEEYRRKAEEERREEERSIYARLHALTGNYIVVYVIDPETNNYREFSATDNYEESFAQAKEGKDFFTTLREAARIYSHPEDRNHVLSLLTKENVMAEVKRSGIFALKYRIMMEGKPLHVRMKAAMVEEKEGQRLVVGLIDIDAQVRQEEELGKRLAQAQIAANIDALTGIKNRHAFLTAQARLDHQIAERTQSPFATVILDVNDLKKVNDTAGHQAGDQYLQDACQIICDIFKRSPVFRMGGDEFVVIAQGSDYKRMEELLGKVDAHNEEALRTGGIVIACGMARFDDDPCVAAVLDRADRNMYENKSRLKA